MKKIILLIFVLLIQWHCGKDAQTSPSATGVGGSLARFAIAGNKMYVVTTDRLKTFDISNSNQLKQLNEISLGMNDIETIFAFDRNLFIGSRSALHIYQIDSLGYPKFASVAGHSWGCDPVVANDSVAFVTTRNGRTCRLGNNNSNQLIIYNVKDINRPIQISILPMTFPNGVGLDKNILFVCDNGIRVFDVSKPNNLRLIRHIQGVDALDVIPLNGQLLVIGANLLTQMDYKNVDNIKVISEFKLR